MATIPIPTWLLSEAELKDLHGRLLATQADALADGDQPDERFAPALQAIKAELRYRGSIFELAADGSITNHSAN
jgi:hypothetical protein